MTLTARQTQILGVMLELENISLADLKLMLGEQGITAEDIRPTFLAMTTQLDALKDKHQLTNGVVIGALLFLMMAELTKMTAGDFLGADAVETSATEPRQESSAS